MWWDTWTDPDCSILLSCAPSWAHHNLARGADLPWRDHWMQAIYYPRTHTTAVKVAAGMHLACKIYMGLYSYVTRIHFLGNVRTKLVIPVSYLSIGFF